MIHRIGLAMAGLLASWLLLAGCVGVDGAPLMRADAQTIAESLGQSGATTDESTGKALAQAEPEASAATADEASLSTPELIEAAYAQGEISAEERALYLAYALYEYDSLPPAYQSQTPWRGTMIDRELNALLTSPQFCDMASDVQSELERLLGEPRCKNP